MKHSMKANPEFSEKVVDVLAKTLGMTKQEVIWRLMQPWGLKSAVLGNWPNRHLEEARNEVEERLNAALDFMNSAKKMGITAQEFGPVFEKLLAEVERKRQSKDD